MATSRPLQSVSEWDPRMPRMLGVSLAGHVVVLAAVALLQPLAAPRPLPMVAYTVEITDPNALGGRTPPGAPGKALTGGSTAPAPSGGSPKPPEPEAKAAEASPEPPKPPEPKPEAVKIPEPKVEAKVEPKPQPKPEAKPEPKPVPKVEAKAIPKPEAKPAPKPEPKAIAKAETPKPPPKAEPRPEPPKTEAHAEAKAAVSAKSESSGRPGGQTADSTPHDAYAAAADRWRQHGAGGGLGGQDAGSGPIGAGGDGKGGGGQLAGLEFIAYRQQVINAVKAAWTNVLTRPGLVAKVGFEIAADGTVSGVHLVEGSGNAAYDASALRAVQRANPLPPPPAHYVNDFHDFAMEFHSEETGGQGAG